MCNAAAPSLCGIALRLRFRTIAWLLDWHKQREPLRLRSFGTVLCLLGYKGIYEGISLGFTKRKREKEPFSLDISQLQSTALTKQLWDTLFPF